jgi:tetratricopeptide (TPR) repeat protein
MSEKVQRISWTGTVALMLLVATSLLPAAVAGASSEPWLQLPELDLSSLEPAVAAQLRSLDAQTHDRLNDEDASLEALAESVGDLGRHYHTYELDAAAESCYRIARRLASEDFRWPYFLGYLLQSTGRLAEAEAAYLEALAIYRQVPPALLRLGQVYSALDQPEAAERLFTESLALNSTSAAAQAALGEFYATQSRYDEAIRLLEMALETAPEATRLYYPLALAYRGRGDHDQARELMARRGKVGIKPADPLIDGLAQLRTGERAYLLEGQVAFRAGRYEEAVTAFRKAVAAAPESVTARIDLGSALGELGDVEAALAEYDKALEIAPANPTALFNAGQLRARRGELEIALEHLRSAAQMGPEDATIRLQLADLLRRIGDLDNALIHYRAAVELEPNSDTARLGEAQVLVALGRFIEARDVLEQGLAQLPTSGFLAHGLSRLLAMGPDPSIRDGERALELAEKVFATKPEPAYAEVVAAALAELGRCDEAAEWQLRVLEVTSSEELTTRLQEVLAIYQQGAPCAYPVTAAPEQ